MRTAAVLYGLVSKPILQMRKKTPKIHKKWDKWDFAGFEFQKASVYAASGVRTPCPPPKNETLSNSSGFCIFQGKLVISIFPWFCIHSIPTCIDYVQT